jgi:predicted GIY-YIG superfamily endonuclease
MPVTLYVPKSTMTRKRYVGITADLSRRLREHAAGAKML